MERISRETAQIGHLDQRLRQTKLMDGLEALEAIHVRHAVVAEDQLEHAIASLNAGI